MKFDKRIYRWQFLSTLSLRRATQFTGPQSGQDLISIHALLAESDVGSYGKAHCNGISIHALLAESDSARLILTSALWNFYPRSPCGERLPQIGKKTVSAIFLSTLSLRRATSFNADSDFAKLGLFLSTLSLRRATNPDAGRGLL